MCYSGNYQSVMDRMLAKVRLRYEYDNTSDRDLLRLLVEERLAELRSPPHVPRALQRLFTEADKARHQRLEDMRRFELGVYQDWTALSVKQLAKAQVDVDVHRLTLPCKFDLRKFRAFFRCVEDDVVLGPKQKKSLLQLLDSALTMCGMRKEKLVANAGRNFWPTRAQLVEQGFLSDDGYQPAYLFGLLSKHLKPDVFARFAPRIHQFMDDMRGQKCVFDLDYEGLTNYIGCVPMASSRKLWP